MSIALPRLDIEAAAHELATFGFNAIEVHVAQLGPGTLSVPLYEKHAESAGVAIRSAGLNVSSFNAAGDPGFDPHAGPEALSSSSEQLAYYLRMAAAMGAPRVLIWDGRAPTRVDALAAIGTLKDCIEGALDRAKLVNPPLISIELHPFTFALKHRVVDKLASAMVEADVGLCLDVCHFGVALGPHFIETLTPDVCAAVSHIHLCDTDCATSELHFPLGEGIVDLDAVVAPFAGRLLGLAWDLFGWAAPREAMGQGFTAYQRYVERQREKAGR